MESTGFPMRHAITLRHAVLVLIASILLPIGTASHARAQNRANHELAARFAPYNIRDLVYSTSVRPNWIPDGEAFWYEWETADGTTWYVVDPERAVRREVFDRDRIAAELTRITRDPFDAKHLPIRNIVFVDANTLRFDVESSVEEEVPTEEAERGNTQQDSTAAPKKEMRKKVFYFEYDVSTQTLRELGDPEKPDNHPRWASVAPDGSWVVFARHENLYKMSGDDYALLLDARRGKTGDKADEAEEDVEVEEIQLTTGGEEFFSYVASSWRLGQHHGSTASEVEESRDKRKRADIVWSPGSEYFTVMRMDLRKVGDLWIIHSTEKGRPELETYKYGMPGEKDVAQYHLEIGSVTADSTWAVDDSLWTDQQVGVFTERQFRYAGDETAFQQRWLTNEPGFFLMYRQSRDYKRVDVLRIDAATGTASIVFEERFNTYIEVQTPHLLAGGDIIWWSERDGWAHLYRYAPDGTLRTQLTSGPFSVRSVERIAEDEGVLFFEAGGREAGEDPYYLHLYRVGLDGRGLRLLNAGNFDHRTAASASGRYFVNNFSRVDTVPRSTLLRADGQEVLSLEEADFSRLFEAGYRFPEPFTVKAADGTTDLYGVMYKPFDFDSTRAYPLVEYVYPGPQTEAVSKSFSTAANETALAQFGMVVITVGNRGGHPARSKWYHNYGYGNLRDYGLDDKKAAAEQLGARHAWLDLDRIGIYGHSGGGFMSTAAMLVYPDFFKVAVSSSGNHDNRIYNRYWSEQHNGVEEVVSDSGDVSFKFDIGINQELAANLKGRLLLTTSDEDNNVHPASTIRMADALIKANKRFDFFLFPGQRHGYGSMSDYWFWLRAEYFVRHLLGDDSWNADITPLQNERPRTR